MNDLHLGPVMKTGAEPVADLLRTPLQQQVFLDEVPKLRAAEELASFGSRHAGLGPPLSSVGTIRTMPGVGVAPNLPGNRRGGALKRTGNRPHTLLVLQHGENSDAFLQIQEAGAGDAGKTRHEQFSLPPSRPGPKPDPWVRIGRKIGSAALIILLWGTVRSIGRRLMDGIEPDLLDRAQSALAATPGVLAVPALQLRWVGHRLQGSASILVADTSLSAAENITTDAGQRLGRTLRNLDSMVIRTAASPAPRKRGQPGPAAAPPTRLDGNARWRP